MATEGDILGVTDIPLTVFGQERRTDVVFTYRGFFLSFFFLKHKSFGLEDDSLKEMHLYICFSFKMVNFYLDSFKIKKIDFEPKTREVYYKLHKINKY